LDLWIVEDPLIHLFIARPDVFRYRDGLLFRPFADSVSQKNYQVYNNLCFFYTICSNLLFGK